MSSSILKYGQIIRIRSYEKANTFLTSKSYFPHKLDTPIKTSTFKSITKTTPSSLVPPISSTSPTIVNLSFRFFQLPPSKLTTRWTPKRSRQKKLNPPPVPKHSSSNSRQLSPKKEERWFPLVTRWSFGISILNTTFMVHLIAPVQVSVPSRSNSRKNFLKK